MSVKTTIRIILIQATLTQLMILSYCWFMYETLEQAAISTAALVLLVGLYGGALGVLLLGRIGGLPKMVLVSGLTSLFVTLTFVIYPELGLVVEWYVLFGLLFFAGLIAYALSYEPQKEAHR